MTSAHLSRIQTGDRRPSVKVLQRIAKRLHVRVDVLLTEPETDVDEAEAPDTPDPALAAAAVAASRWLNGPRELKA